MILFVISGTIRNAAIADTSAGSAKSNPNATTISSTSTSCQPPATSPSPPYCIKSVLPTATTTVTAEQFHIIRPRGASDLPSLIPASARQNNQPAEIQWPAEDNTYCDLDSTDSSLCWSSYLVPVDYQSMKSGRAPVSTADSSLDLSAINELSIDELHTLEHSLETSLAEISSILPEDGPVQPHSSSRNEQADAKFLPRNSTPNLRNVVSHTLSIHKSNINGMPPPSGYHYASSGCYRRNTISHPVSSGYRQMQQRLQQRPMSVPQPISSGEYSEYIQRLAFEGDSTNDSSMLNSTFASYRSRNLLSSNAQPVTTRQRPACIGQDSSLVTVQDLSTYTHVNDSTTSAVQLEDPGSDTSESEITSRLPSGDSNPDIPNMTMDSDATCFMDNPMCSRPVTFKQKGSRYKTMSNRLRKVGQQIKNKGTRNFKTLAVL